MKAATDHAMERPAGRSGQSCVRSPGRSTQVPQAFTGTWRCGEGWFLSHRNLLPPVNAPGQHSTALSEEETNIPLKAETEAGLGITKIHGYSHLEWQSEREPAHISPVPKNKQLQNFIFPGVLAGTWHHVTHL